MTRLIAALAACLLAAPALAEQVCGPWETMLLYAANRYAEYPAFLASSDTGAVTVITVNPETKTYTVFAQPNETTMCVVGSGKGWGEAPDAVIDNIRNKVGELYT